MSQTKSINFSGKCSIIRKSYYPPIKLDPKKKNELALIRLETYNSIPNIDENNNLIICEVNTEVLNIKIPTGSYELSQINDVIQKQLEI